MQTKTVCPLPASPDSSPGCSPATGPNHSLTQKFCDLFSAEHTKYFSLPGDFRVSMTVWTNWLGSEWGGNYGRIRSNIVSLKPAIPSELPQQSAVKTYKATKQLLHRVVWSQTNPNTRVSLIFANLPSALSPSAVFPERLPVCLHSLRDTKWVKCASLRSN